MFSLSGITVQIDKYHAIVILPLRISTSISSILSAVHCTKGRGKMFSETKVFLVIFVNAICDFAMTVAVRWTCS